jgi:hypothetical protein
MPADDSGRPSSDAPDEHIPLQGTHQGDTDDPLTSSVRGQEPPDPTPPAERVEEDEAGDPKSNNPASSDARDGDDETASSEAAGSTGEDVTDQADDLGAYQLSHDPASGRHRVRVRPPADETEAPGGGFKELSRHSSPEDMSDALEGRRADGPRFVVLENSETGEAFFDREGALSDDWFDDARYDQVTLFESEDEAAAYADE